MWNIVRPGMSPKEIVKALRELDGVIFTSTGMRDAGQSDYKNRHRIHDLATLAPYYEKMGLFSPDETFPEKMYYSTGPRASTAYPVLTNLRITFLPPKKARK
jgi:hypothetical protein